MEKLREWKLHAARSQGAAPVGRGDTTETSLDEPAAHGSARAGGANLSRDEETVDLLSGVRVAAEDGSDSTVERRECDEEKVGLLPDTPALRWANDAHGEHGSETTPESLHATSTPNAHADLNEAEVLDVDVADKDRWLVALFAPLLVWFALPCAILQWETGLHTIMRHWLLAIVLLVCCGIPCSLSFSCLIDDWVDGTSRSAGKLVSTAVVSFMSIGAVLFVAANISVVEFDWEFSWGHAAVILVILLCCCVKCWCDGTVVSEALESVTDTVGALVCASVCLAFAGLLICMGIASYFAPMTLVPIMLLTSGSGSKASSGAAIFVGMLWTLGWALLWYKLPRLKPIEKAQHLVGLPSESLTLQLKPIVVALECFNYCGFSFFPALPWKVVEVPSDVPHPQKIMMAGFFEFEDVDKQLISFTACAIIVVLALILFIITREDTATNLLVLQIFFELLSFPVIKKLTSVFSCTSNSVWEESDDGTMQPFCDMNTTEAALNEWEYVQTHVECGKTMSKIQTWSECEAAAAYLGLLDTSLGNVDDLNSTVPHGCYYDTDMEMLLWASDSSLQELGEAIKPLCIHLYDEDVQCMDNDPSTECWEPKHLVYVLTAMIILVPYYLLTLYEQLEAQKRSSVVVIDGVWTVVSLQNKFMLAVIASAFGDCYPHVIVVSVEASVLAQLILMCTRSYSSVLKLNAIRLGGLICAAIDGMYAIFILISYTDDPRASPPCSRTCNGTNSVLNDSDVLSSHTDAHLVHTYKQFFCLVGLNCLGVLCGVGYYLVKKHGCAKCSCSKTTWVEVSTSEPTWTSINEDAREVDYPIVRSRLDKLPRLVKIAAGKQGQQTTVSIRRQRCCVTTRPEMTKISDLNSIEVDDVAYAARELGLYTGSPDRLEFSANDSGNATFDLRLCEHKTSGQQLESATLNAVLSNKLLSYPLGVNLLDVDLSQASGVMLCSTLHKIGGHDKHPHCGHVFCTGRCPFLRLGKSRPAARIAMVCITNLHDKEAIKKYLTPFLFHALNLMGPCQVVLPTGEEASVEVPRGCPKVFIKGGIRLCSLVPTSTSTGVTLRFTAEQDHVVGGDCNEVSGTILTGKIIGDSPEVALEDTTALDLRADSSFVEVEKETFEIVRSTERCGHSFTVEAWVAYDDEDLSSEQYNNPLISHHGVAAGFELRLGARGEASFLITIDGKHVEVNGKEKNPARGGDGGRSSKQLSLRHLAGVYNAETRVLQVWSGMECVGHTVVPAGEYSVFDGPLNLARNPQWTERHCPCYLAAVRFSQLVLDPVEFLKLANHPSTN